MSTSDQQYYFTSLNHNIFDVEKTLQGAPIGNENGGVVWYPNDWNYQDRYDGSNCARRCYKQAYSGGTYGSCAIVYDALGGARKAYTVRTGFWNNGGGNGWSQFNPAGPQSAYGMPITNEYAISGGARQDFQKGFVTYLNGSIAWATYASIGKTAPGWTSSGWNNQYSYLFARAYERNGAHASVGDATGNIYNYGTFLRQDFSGGSFGNCCILYDPDNATGNLAATNEAYLLRSEFYAHYNAVVGYQAYGCPSLDEYGWNDPGDKVQFFVKRDGSSNPQHRMEYDASTGQFAWHSVYATDWVSQTPSGAVTMSQDETRTFTVTFQNTGTTTWYNNASNYPYDYICLKSTDLDGNATTSLLYGSGLSWIDDQTPCTMTQSSVAPGSNATFTFTGKVPSGQAPGAMNVYFRPEHSVAGLLSDWGGMHFQVNVVDQYIPLVGKFTSDGNADVCLYEPMTGGWYVAVSNGSNAFTPSASGWLGNWGANTAAYTPLVGDFTGDGKTDVGLYEMASGGWFVATSTGAAFTASAYAWLANWGANATAYRALAGDFNGDGKTDVCLYEPANGGWFVALSNGSSAFTPSGSAWLGNWGVNATAYRPFTGDFNSDGKTDVGLYEAATGGWFVAISNGASAFTPAGSAWLANWGANATAYQNLSGDFTGEGRSDVCLFEGATGGWFVATSSGSAFVPAGSAWLANWAASATAFRPMSSDVTGDGKSDIVLYEPAYGAWYVASSNGSAFTPSPYAWLGSWGIGKVALDETPSIPQSFALQQNYPNPFNPVTTIAYTLPSAMHVTLDVFNILGQRVAVLVDEHQTAGEHIVIWDANPHASGVYFYRLRAGEATETKKMLLLK